jgi:hypothetical protein
MFFLIKEFNYNKMVTIYMSQNQKLRITDEQEFVRMLEKNVFFSHKKFFTYICKANTNELRDISTQKIYYNNHRHNRYHWI